MLKHRVASSKTDKAPDLQFGLIQASEWGNAETDYATKPTHIFEGGAEGDVWTRREAEPGGADWSSPSVLVGPEGPQGPIGATGAEGPIGPTGPAGATGPAGSFARVVETATQLIISGPASNSAPVKIKFEGHALANVFADNVAYNGLEVDGAIGTANGAFFFRTSNGAVIAFGRGGAGDVIRLRDGSNGVTPFLADMVTGQMTFWRGWQVLNNGGVRPAAEEALRGTYWHTYGGAGVADSVDVCVKLADDTYAWAPLLG